jgi:hypothetical protein
MHHLERLVQAARWCTAFGLVVLAAGVIMLFGYPYLGGWAFYALVTPLLIATGTAVTAFASRVRQRLSRERPVASSAGAPAPGAAGPSRTARWTANVLVYVVIAATVFWATATVAQWSGLGLAEHEALSFGDLPSVILDSKEPLYLRDPYVTETVLPATDGQTFRYRYRGLRLLIQGPDRMFLVPDKWSASDSTLVVPADGSVRLQFRFQNQPP